MDIIQGIRTVYQWGHYGTMSYGLEVMLAAVFFSRPTKFSSVQNLELVKSINHERLVAV